MSEKEIVAMYGLIFALFGLLFVFGSGYISALDLALMVFSAGVCLTVIGLFLTVNWIRPFLPKRKLRENTRGIVWVWVVALATLALMAIAWWSLGQVAFMVMDQVESQYAFPSESLATIGFVRNVLAFFLLIMTVGIIVWALVNSARREDVTYPVY